MSMSEGSYASAASVKLLVTYAMGDGKAVSDCHSMSGGCKAMFYMDPNHVWAPGRPECTYHPDADIVSAAPESWFVHDTGYSDASHRVYGKDALGCTVFELNPLAGSYQNWWRTYLRNNADAYDVYFIDDNMMDVLDASYFPHSGGGCTPWPSYCRSTREIANDAAEVAARVSFANAMTHADGSPMYFFFQQASFDIPLDLSAFNSTGRFKAISCEGCVSTAANPARSNLYARVLDEMAAVNANGDIYMLMSRGGSPSGSPTQILQRLVTVGITWLGYSEGHTVVRPNLESNTNKLAVWPEDLIYPSAPLQSMVTGAADLAVGPGVFRREFKTCYQAGRFFGRCAVIVNPTGSTVAVRATWLRATYSHVVSLTGGDVLSGGTASVNGLPLVPNVTTIAPASALLLTQ
jgi:hypothetical protein